jgi:hypothetical protein
MHGVIRRWRGTTKARTFISVCRIQPCAPKSKFQTRRIWNGEGNFDWRRGREKTERIHEKI